MNEKYDSSKASIINTLGKLKSITDSLNMKIINENISELINKILSDSFYLVLMGQFKRGKSTFLNYILGNDVLPTSAIPLTSIVTKVFYESKSSVSVSFNNGEKKAIQLQELFNYCTEQGNPENKKNVKEIEIGYPFDFINQDVILIDTPGIGSIYKHNTDATQEFLPKADAVIFMLSVDPPLSDIEKDFLTEIKNHVDKIFFALNKIDYSDQKTVNEITCYTKKVLSETLDINDVTLYPISARQAFEGKRTNNNELLEKSNISILESKIAKFLIEEKANTLINNSNKSIMKIAAFIENFINSSINLKKLSVDQLKDKVKKFEDFLENFESSKKEIGFLFNGETKDILGKVDKMIDDYKGTIASDIKNKLKLKLNNLKKANRTFVEEELNQYLESLIVENFNEWKLDVQAYVEKRYNNTLEKYNNKVNEIISSISEAVIELFNMDLEYFNGNEILTAKSEFSYKIGNQGQFSLIDINSTSFGSILPKSLFERILLKSISNKADSYIDKTCGGIRYDILMRLQRSWGDFEYDLSQKVNNIVNTVKSMIPDASNKYLDNVNESNSELEKYNSLLQILKEINEKPANSSS